MPDGRCAIAVVAWNGVRCSDIPATFGIGARDNNKEDIKTTALQESTTACIKRVFIEELAKPMVVGRMYPPRHGPMRYPDICDVNEGVVALLRSRRQPSRASGWVRLCRQFVVVTRNDVWGSDLPETFYIGPRNTNEEIVERLHPKIVQGCPLKSSQLEG